MSAKKKVTTASKKKATPSLRKKPALSLVANTTEIQLFDSPGLPPVTRRGNGANRVYPFGAMEIGKAFFIGAAIDTSKYADAGEADKAQREACQQVANRLSGAVRRFTKKHEDFKFAVRTAVKDGAPGVWVERIAFEGKQP